MYSTYRGLELNNLCRSSWPCSATMPVRYIWLTILNWNMCIASVNDWSTIRRITWKHRVDSHSPSVNRVFLSDPQGWRRRMRRRWRNRPEDSDFLRGSVDVEKRPELQCLIDMHENNWLSTIFRELNFSRVQDTENEFVAYLRSAGNILLHHPILSTVQKWVWVFRKYRHVQSVRITWSQTESQSAGVHCLSCYYLNYYFLS